MFLYNLISAVAIILTASDLLRVSVSCRYACAVDGLCWHDI